MKLQLDFKYVFQITLTQRFMDFDPFFKAATLEISFSIRSVVYDAVYLSSRIEPLKLIILTSITA